MEYVNNFDKIKNLLTFETDDDFYLLQIIRRRKENPELGVGAYVVKTYYITSLEKLEQIKDDVVFFCDHYHARAYINPNVKSFKSATLGTLKELANAVANDDYHKPYSVFDGVVGQIGAKRNKTWIVDLDKDDNFTEMVFNAYIDIVKNIINQECEPEGDKVIDVLPTFNGVHILTRPFNLKKFSEHYPKTDVHKNNPTILYASK